MTTVQLDDIKRIAVIGAGLMGHGIAQEFAAAGYNVALTDADPAVLARVPGAIRDNLRAVAEITGKPAPDAEILLSRIQITSDLGEACESADVLVEAVSEHLDLKRQLFAEFDRLCPPRTILASNTSSFMPSQLASVTKRPAQVLVAHYFNPPHLVPLVELVRGAETSDATIDTMEALYRKFGKSPVVVQKEALGFIGNRLQKALLREALSLVEQGIATPRDVDTVMTSSIGRRWSVAGVFEVFDLAGLDLLLAVMSEIQPDLENTRDVSRILRDHVATGQLGAKSGKGFYDWTPESIEASKQKIRRARFRDALTIRGPSLRSG